MLSEPAKLPFKAAPFGVLIERDITEKIRNKIDAVKQDSVDSKTFISILGLKHNPGAGATTVGKHILWKMKDKFRCGYVDNKLVVEGTSQILLNFPVLGEGTIHLKSKLKTVLIFLDNSSLREARLLKQDIELKADNSRTLNMSAQIIIIFTERKVDLNEKPENLDFNLPCILNPGEQNLFKAKLEVLEKCKEFNPNDMLSFVIMANGFEEDNEYVKKVVRSNIEEIRNIRQERLLHILSIYKFFSNGNANLIHSICETFLGKSDKRILDRLRAGAKPFLVSRPCSEEGYGCYEVLEVTNRPVAKQVLKFLNMKHEINTQKVLLDFFQEPALQTVFLKQKTYFDIHSLLVVKDQAYLEEEEEKEIKPPKFSPLIEEIRNDKKFNQTKVVELLNSGFEVTREYEHSAAPIAQSIARYLIDQKDHV